MFVGGAETVKKVTIVSKRQGVTCLVAREGGRERKKEGERERGRG